MLSASPSSILFLKLGGSIITDKTRSHTARLDVLNRLAEEIALARTQNPAMRLLFGHGSGSFGHVPAQRYDTRQGVRTPEQWRGFVEVWKEAAELNHLVTNALGGAGLPAIAFPPSASVTAEEGRVVRWELEPLQSALGSGLIPVVYGDVVFDRVRGGTILSTEDLFAHLARCLHPARLLLAGIEPGVWEDYPSCTRLVREITPENYLQFKASLSGSAATDVTGGMASKVREMLALVGEIPGLQVLVFSGFEVGQLTRALMGENPGTLIYSGIHYRPCPD